MSEAIAPAAPFEINGKLITETAVHIYAVMRLRVAIEPTQDPKQAIEKALKQTDLDHDLRHGEYAEEITGMLVDQISGDYAKGDYEYEEETFLTEDGFVDHRSQVEQGKYLVIGSSNIPQVDGEALTKVDPLTGPIMVANTGYGWIVSLRPGSHTAAENLEEDLRKCGLSDAFIALWKGLRERGFGLLQIDRDASPHPEFPTFEW